MTRSQVRILPGARCDVTGLGIAQRLEEAAAVYPVREAPTLEPGHQVSLRREPLHDGRDARHRSTIAVGGAELHLPGVGLDLVAEHSELDGPSIEHLARAERVPGLTTVSRPRRGQLVLVACRTGSNCSPPRSCMRQGTDLRSRSPYGQDSSPSDMRRSWLRDQRHFPDIQA
jgi:hypothetical protein